MDVTLSFTAIHMHGDDFGGFLGIGFMDGGNGL